MPAYEQEVGAIAHPDIAGRRRTEAERVVVIEEIGARKEQCGQDEPGPEAPITIAARIMEGAAADPVEGGWTVADPIGRRPPGRPKGGTRPFHGPDRTGPSSFDGPGGASPSPLRCLSGWSCLLPANRSGGAGLSPTLPRGRLPLGLHLLGGHRHVRENQGDDGHGTNQPFEKAFHSALLIAQTQPTLCSSSCSYCRPVSSPLRAIIPMR